MSSAAAELFVVGADLATNPDERAKLEPGVSLVSPDMVARLEESRIDELVETHPLANAFVVPGANPVSACLDLARSTIRRAERRVVELRESHAVVNEEAFRYLNRLSDALFVLRASRRARPNRAAAPANRSARRSGRTHRSCRRRTAGRAARCRRP